MKIEVNRQEGIRILVEHVTVTYCYEDSNQECYVDAMMNLYFDAKM